jgi:hypothetical protein
LTSNGLHGVVPQNMELYLNKGLENIYNVETKALIAL